MYNKSRNYNILKTSPLIYSLVLLLPREHFGSIVFLYTRMCYVCMYAMYVASYLYFVWLSLSLEPSIHPLQNCPSTKTHKNPHQSALSLSLTATTCMPSYPSISPISLIHTSTTCIHAFISIHHQSYLTHSLTSTTCIHAFISIHHQSHLTHSQPPYACMHAFISIHHSSSSNFTRTYPRTMHIHQSVLSSIKLSLPHASPCNLTVYVYLSTRSLIYFHMYFRTPTCVYIHTQWHDPIPDSSWL